MAKKSKMKPIKSKVVKKAEPKGQRERIVPRVDPIDDDVESTQSGQPRASTMSQREAEDTEHSARMARAANPAPLRTAEEVMQPREAAFHIARASTLALEAEDSFYRSRVQTINAADRVVLWGEARTLAKLAQAHAETARAIIAYEEQHLAQ